MDYYILDEPVSYICGRITIPCKTSNTYTYFKKLIVQLKR